MSRANADKCSHPPILSWQFASCRNISSSLAPVICPQIHIPPRTKIKWPGPSEALTMARKNAGLWDFGFMNLGVKEKIRFKRLMGVLARLFNPIRFRGSCLINSDSNTDLLLPKHLEIVFLFLQNIVFDDHMTKVHSNKKEREIF